MKPYRPICRKLRDKRTCWHVNRIKGFTLSVDSWVKEELEPCSGTQLNCTLHRKHLWTLPGRSSRKYINVYGYVYMRTCTCILVYVMRSICNSMYMYIINTIMHVCMYFLYSHLVVHVLCIYIYTHTLPLSLSPLCVSALYIHIHTYTLSFILSIHKCMHIYIHT